ncbi:DUF2007 domain-containing protein [Gelidibacter salicanalis]|uniref:DUF2007 domain-containing protein n=1 Tax=Gelidibacter salicanalis TaxID=291193 RepID=A0A5C7AI92_9FLAO|nr:DUF2007 domain-containing protein [Gelidibacter salicanalis]TXE07704.1 DUF2007 domain-containing protein [Gelidibacter salicanalis]
MADTNYIKVFSGNFIYAQMIINRLEEVGIRAVVKDESESGRLAGFGSPIQGFQDIYVSEDELTKALPIVELANSDLKAQKNPE